MKQTAGALNRTWLIIIALVLLLAGGTTILQATGGLANMFQTPEAHTKIASGDLHQFFAEPAVYTGFLIAGVLFGSLAIWWIFAQLPRSNGASTFRLHQDRSKGTTTIDPGTLSNAVQEQIDGMEGVVSSSVIIRGATPATELTVHVRVSESTPLTELTKALAETIIPSLETALETTVASSQVLIDVVNQSHGNEILVKSRANQSDTVRLAR